MGNDELNEENLEIQNIEEEIMNFFEDIMYDRGSSPLLGRIYGLCVINTSKRQITQKDLIRKFKVNPSTVSRNLKELEKWHLVHKKRQPGSLEWEYKIDSSSFFELLTHQIEKYASNLPERRDALILIRDHWAKTLSDETKQTFQAKRDLEILNFLIKWISRVTDELDSFVKRLRRIYIDLEEEMSNIWNKNDL